MKTKIIALVAAALAIAGCGGKASLEGAWVEPNPIAPDQVQGIQIDADGTASSINMATLRYKSWKMEGDSLALTLESEGSGDPFTMTLTYGIKKLDKDSLVLSGEFGTLRFARQL